MAGCRRYGSSRIGIDVVSIGLIYSGSNFGNVISFRKIGGRFVGDGMRLFFFYLWQRKFFFASVMKNGIQRVATAFYYAL